MKKRWRILEILQINATQSFFEGTMHDSFLKGDCSPISFLMARSPSKVFHFRLGWVCDVPVCYIRNHPCVYWYLDNLDKETDGCRWSKNNGFKVWWQFHLRSGAPAYGNIWQCMAYTSEVFVSIPILVSSDSLIWRLQGTFRQRSQHEV